MKTLPLIAAVCCSLFAAFNSSFAQGTAFTYQGRLNNSGNPASGSYDLTFTIYDSTNIPGNVIAGPITNSATLVSNGLFTTTLDFGSNVFNGNAAWLEIGVRTNGNAAFATLSPRQQLTPTPYAMFANTASNLVGTVSASQITRLLYYVTGSSEISGTGAISGRTLTFTKTQASSRLRITYSDNLGIVTLMGNTDVDAFWEVKLDAASISPTPIKTYFYSQVGNKYLFQPATLVGYATGVAAGVHTLAVYASSASGNNGTLYTGNGSYYLLEVEEIP